jgi:hypothetical protein
MDTTKEFVIMAKQTFTIICTFILVNLFASTILNESIAGDHNFDILKGEWIRPDGGYVLKINKINEDGFVNAEYLNPKSIRIQNARISLWKEYLKLVVQFNDAGYKCPIVVNCHKCLRPWVIVLTALNKSD